MGNYTKSIIAFVAFVAGVILSYMGDGVISANEWTLIAAAVASWLGVTVFPNTKNGENVNTLAREALIKRRNPEA